MEKGSKTEAGTKHCRVDRSGGGVGNWPGKEEERLRSWISCIM